MNGHNQPHLATVILIAAGSVITLTLFMPALADIADELGVSQIQISWALSGYMLATAFLQLIIGPLSDRFGRRPVVLVSFAIFTLASLVAALAPNATIFFIGRFVQAAAIAGMVLSQAIVRDMSVGKDDTASRLATVTMVMAIAPILGPILGGVLSDNFGWRSNFVFLAGFGVVTVFVSFKNLYETNLSPSKTFGAQFYAYPKLLRSGQFWGFTLSIATAAGMFYSFLISMPLVGRDQFDLSKLQIGLCLAALPIGYMSGNLLVRAKSRVWGIAFFIVLGRLLAVLPPLFTLGCLAIGVTHIAIYLPLILIGTANAFTIPTANAGVVSINPRIAGSAAGLAASQTLLFGVIASFATAFFIERSPTVEFMLWAMLIVAALGIYPAWMVWRDRHK